MSLYSCSLPFAQGMFVFEAAMKRKAVSYISQAADLNFLLYLHIWSWYARRSGARWGYRDRVERRKTFQASSQDDKPSIRRFLRCERTKDNESPSWGSTLSVKLFCDEAWEGCGYMLSVSKSLKSMYSRLVILVRIFSGSGGNVLSCGGCGAGWWTGTPREP